MSSETSPVVVSFDAVSKQFPSTSRRSLVREASPFHRFPPTGTAALEDVSFQVGAGQSLGVIGRNGAGKSTLLKLAAGIMEPTVGSVSVAGSPGSMIELGLAFQPELSGWENLPSAAALFGLDRDQFEAVVDDVVEFSGLRDLLDLPVKHFSTGMVARLGFALATHLPARVLLIDEVLAVGDRRFQNACIDRVRELVRAGVSLLFVSHDLDLVCHVCERAVCLDGGRVVDEGPATEVVGRYAREMLAPRSPGWRRSARIASLEVERAAISTGESFAVRCVVDVDESGERLGLQSQMYPPSSSSGLRNIDTLDLDALQAAGRWVLEGTIGPIQSTAATLELELAIVHGQGTEGRPTLVDVQTVPVEIIGEEMGAPLWVMDGNWRVRSIDDILPIEPAGARTPVTSSVVDVDGLTKTFARRRLGVQESLSGRGTGRSDRGLVAIDEVAFNVSPGEAVGLIGSNGAGKSTLLRMLAGVSEPSRGRVTVRGSVVAVLELGIGFHPEMTGEQNLQFTWALEGGAPDAYVAARHSILEFADVGDVLNLPVKHYSTGMRARLALALALELEPEVLLIDEALSTGDIEFRQRVLQRLSGMCARGTTLLFASHDLHMITLLCSRVLRLDAGRLVDDGPSAEVIARAGGAGWAGGSSTAEGGVVIRSLEVVPDVLEWGEPLDVAFEVEVQRPSPNVYLEFSMRQSLAENERADPKSPSEILQMSLCVQRLESVRSVVDSPGVHSVVGRIENIPAANSTDVVISAIDAVDGTVLSESWHTVFLGSVNDLDLVGRLSVVWAANGPHAADGPAALPL